MPPTSSPPANLRVLLRFHKRSRSFAWARAAHPKLPATIAALVFSFALFILFPSLAQAQTFADSGFVSEVVTKLAPYQPTGLTFAPDGRIFIWQKSGVVRIFKNGALLPTPFIDLQPRVNIVNDRGLLGLALDPNFATNGYVYLLYTYEEGGDPNNAGPKTARLTRVTANPSNPDVALTNSEVVILGSLGTPPCSNYPAGSDCIPSDSKSHTVGTLRFGADGKLFVGIGDGAGYADTDVLALRAQDLNSYSGKILRINRDGSAPGDNPFNDGTNSIRSKVYSYGLRNPYRFSLHPVTGEVYLGDVGWDEWEEINRGRGANFGWPCYEGNSPQPQYYPQFQQCQQLPASAVTPPLYAYSHSEGQAVIGGVFYNATQYPQQYSGNYFFADYGAQFIRRMTFGSGGNLLSVQTFATNVVAPVSLELGPDGSLYYISLSTGEVRRIKFSGIVAKASANPLWGYSPLNVAFSSAGSLDPLGGALTYLWEFGDGTTSTTANPSHTYASTGVKTFNAKLTVKGSQNRSAVDTVSITVGSTPPTATILSPANGTVVRPGDVVNFQGAATDPDQTLAPSALTWSVLLHHDNHVHPYATATGTGGSFTVESHGEGGTYSYEIILTATDSSGLTNSRSVTLPVDAVQLPSPWLSRDIGAVGAVGSASYSNSVFTIRGAGEDIWDTEDRFHFVYQPLSGDGEIVARVVSLENTHTNAKAGVMIRETLAPDSRHAILNVTPEAGIEFMRRTTTGGTMTNIWGGAETAPKWLKLARAGSTFSAYKSNDGASWTLIGTSTISMAANVYIGMAVTSHDNPVLCTGVLDNVSVHFAGGNSPPAVSITSPASGATFNAPASVTINASASDTDGTITRVEFYAGTNLLGTDTTAPYSFDWNNIVAGNYTLTAKATDNSGAITVSAPVNIAVNSPSTTALTDDFNDNQRDAAKWNLGVLNLPPDAYDPNVPVREQNQRLEITPLANSSTWSHNGYVTAPTFDMTGGRASVEVVQVTNGSAYTILALGLDSDNWYRMTVRSGQLSFQEMVAGTKTSASFAYSPAQHRFWRIRHDSATDQVLFETSSDNLNWTTQRTVKRQISLSGVRAELDAGSFEPVSSPGLAIFDNFRLESNGGAPVNIPPAVSITSPADGASAVAPASINISASASDADGAVARVEFYAGSTLLGTDTSAPYSFSWSNVAAGSYVLTARATDNVGATTVSAPVNITVSGGTTLPLPWLQRDIGSVGFTGSANFSGGVFTVRGSGADIWDNVDAFHYVYQTLNSDGQIIARVTDIQYTDDWAKAGVMIRESLAPDARHASMFLTANSGLAFQRRVSTGGVSAHDWGGDRNAPYWVKLVRSGNSFSAYRSSDGVNWTQVGQTISISMSASVYVGLAVTSHNNDALCTATFDNVSVTTGPIH